MMRSTQRTIARRRGIGAACLTLVCAGSTVLAQANPAVPLVAFQHEGLAAMMPDRKDAGLLAALQMLPARLKEIHAAAAADIQHRMPWFTQDMVDLGWDMMTQPTRLIVTNRGTDPNTGQPLIGAVVSVKMRDQNTANLYHERLLGIIRQQAARAGLEITDSRRVRTMSEFATPMGPLSFGPRDAADGWRYEILFGSAPGPDRAFDDMPTLPEGNTTTASFMIDFNAIGPMVQPFVGMAMMSMPQEQGQQLMQQLSAAGVIGPNTIKVEWAAGFSPTHAVQSTRVIGMKKNAEALGMSLEPITQEELAMIPRDATAATIWKADPMTAWNNLQAQLGPAAVDVNRALAEFGEQTGVDLVNDVIATLGSTGAMYLSDSTGGGSLMSAAFVSTLKDGARLRDANARLLSQANRFIADNSPSPDTIGFRFDSTPLGNGSMIRLRAEGLPILLMPTYAIGANHLVAGLTPQACSAAVAQTTRRANESLLANASFAENMGRWRSPITISFVDTQRTLRDGYGLTQFAATMLETFVSSPYGNRSAGNTMPAMNELLLNARPLLQVTSWEGEDLVVHTTSDRSALVTLSGVLGVGDVAPLLIGGIIGSGMTALVEEFGDGFQAGLQRGQRIRENQDADWMDDEDDDIDF